MSGPQLRLVRDPVDFRRQPNPPVDPPGGGGDDGDMDARVAKLEQIAVTTGEKLVGIETRLTKIETRADNFATKADVHDATLKLTHWIVGTAIALGATSLTVMTFVLNNAVPKQAQTAQQPTVIVVPGAAAAPTIQPPATK